MPARRINELSNVTPSKMQELVHVLDILNKNEVTSVTDAITILMFHVKSALPIERLPGKTINSFIGPLPIKACQSEGCGGTLVGRSMSKPFNIDGISVIRCSKSCGYSEVLK